MFASLAALLDIVLSELRSDGEQEVSRARVLLPYPVGLCPGCAQPLQWALLQPELMAHPQLGWSCDPRCGGRLDEEGVTDDLMLCQGR